MTAGLVTESLDMMHTPTTGIIADDEDLPRQDLRRALESLWPELKIVAECEHGEEALEAIDRLHPHVAFLDIRMPGLNGIDIAHAASGRCHVVFVTAYDRYALDAFDAGALDYVLKPFNRERLGEAIKRVQQRTALPPPDLSEALRSLERHLRERQETKRLHWVSANAGNVIKIIAVDDIVYFESDEKYTRVVTAEEQAHVRMPLKDLLACLDSDRFWQIHRGIVVQADKIACVRRDEMGRFLVDMRSVQEPLRVSQAYAWRFKAM
jgi:DNA-binding LytR/AlgR family response regulator